MDQHHEHAHGDPDHGRPGHVHDPACAMAHGDLASPVADRRLLAVFVAPVAVELVRLAPSVGYDVALLDPTPSAGAAPPGVPLLRDVGGAAPNASTDVVVCDHDRPELGDVLAELLTRPCRWVGVMGSLRHTAPHLAALRDRGVPEADIGRVHRPIGLDIGARAPGEIALATLAGLLADRNGRAGGAFGSPAGAAGGRVASFGRA